MGAKSRAAMAEAAARLEARKAETLGPKAPPCQVCGKPSTGVVDVRGRPVGPVCSPLSCGITLAGEANFSVAGFAKHAPGRYREA